MNRSNMAHSTLKDKIRQVLKNGDFQENEDFVDVSDGSGNYIHLVIVSRKFDGLRLKEKNNLIWSQLMKNLAPEEWGNISLSVGFSPEELKAVV